MKTITGDRYLRSLMTTLFCCVLILFSVSAWAQSTTEGAIGGTVVDPDNKVIPGASVSIGNKDSNQAFATVTDPGGYFRVGQLPPATYIVTVNAEGFAPYKAEKVIVIGRQLDTGSART